MFVWIKSCKIEKIGFFLFLRSNRIHIMFSSDEELQRIEIKPANSYIGCVIMVPDVLKTIKMTVAYDAIEKYYELLLYEGVNNVEISFEQFYGHIEYLIIKDCFFTLLENMMIDIECKFKAKINKHSEQICEISNGIFERKAFSGMTYYGNIYDNVVNYTSDKARENCTMPRGWERRILPTGRAYYINHNKNYTQWDKPNDISKIVDIKKRIKNYRQKTSTIKIMAMFDRGKTILPVCREYIVQSTADLLLRSNFDVFLRDTVVVFAGEIGQDWGAMLKEFFYKASLEILNDERFKCIGCVYDVKTIEERKKENDPMFKKHLRTNSKGINRIFDVIYFSDVLDRDKQDPTKITPIVEHILETNPIIKSVERGKNVLTDEDFFTYVGVFLGFAFQRTENVSIDLSLAFFENLMARNFGINLIQDSQTQKGLNYIKNSDLTKEVIYDEIKGIPLTLDTRDEYVDALILDHLYWSKKEECDWIKAGFNRVVYSSISNYLQTMDLFYVLRGNEEVTYEMIVSSIVLIKCTQDTPEIIYLLKILKEGDETFLRTFLQFLTGSPSIPTGELKNHRFKWYIEATSTENMYFRVTTCMNRLYIGKYASYEDMKKFMLFSIQNTEGFHKV